MSTYKRLTVEEADSLFLAGVELRFTCYPREHDVMRICVPLSAAAGQSSPKAIAASNLGRDYGYYVETE